MGPEALNYTLGIKLGSGQAGMGMGISKQGVDSVRTEFIILASDYLVEVDKCSLLSAGYTGGPAGVGISIANDLAVFPDFSRNE